MTDWVGDNAAVSSACYCEPPTGKDRSYYPPTGIAIINQSMSGWDFLPLGKRLGVDFSNNKHIMMTKKQNQQLLSHQESRLSPARTEMYLPQVLCGWFQTNNNKKTTETDFHSKIPTGRLCLASNSNKWEHNILSAPGKCLAAPNMYANAMPVQRGPRGWSGTADWSIRQKAQSNKTTPDIAFFGNKQYTCHDIVALQR